MNTFNLEKKVRAYAPFQLANYVIHYDYEFMSLTYFYMPF